ncbi:cation diffusion facilitator family transporter [Mycobacterium basiliense]|uniref:Cation diffusion facilitator family transporter n=1 Tax=Mycobacterium basiliense TaxID=2094119 RepID=A0A3S5CZV8_9MYCO|nr:cation transporter [Mycobacterium basiliense]VDM89396.1 cation diffusion facilitator family transporter [Mycobacterium basiliense]
MSLPGPLPEATDGSGDRCADTHGCRPVTIVEIDRGWHEAARRARLLSWISLGYMATEGLVAIVAAVVAGSVALLGFGLDSAIEGAASVIVIWRFTGTRTLSPTVEKRAQKAVAVTFFLLAPYIAYDAVTALTARDRPQTSWVGIALAITSMIVMPLLGRAKRHLGARLGSATTSGEGTQNLLCAYLAGAVLVGLLGNALWGWWWLDPVVALAIAVLAVWEGTKTWRGDECC